jgi:ElaB/YqjD/DUF883 family membrane-anchored ribosome-binding protein
MSSVANRTIVRLKDFRVGDVGSRVSNAVGSLAKSAAETTDGFVRSSPWRAAGAIAVAGVAAGILVARRARRHAADDANTDSTSEVLGG